MSFVQHPPYSIPLASVAGLSESEKALIQKLQRRRDDQRKSLWVSEAYYHGKQQVDNLRIAVPQEMEFLATIPGWGAQAVDPYVERLNLDGFRLPGATDSDSALGDLWRESGGAAAQSLAYTDALVTGRAYWVVGSPAEPGSAPVVTVESPLNMTVLWDYRGVDAEAAWQEYWADGRRNAVLYTPDQTIYLVSDEDTQGWAIAHRDEHNFGEVPIVRMVNRPRTSERDGFSEITQPLRNTIDSAARTLLGLEVAREIYSAPRYVLLGALESYFKNADGTSRTTLQSYMTDVWGLERDQDGEIPAIQQLQAYDPSTFTKLIEMYASQAAGILAAPPQDLGLYTQGNPTSAEAQQVSESRRDRRARKRQDMFGPALERVARLLARFDGSSVDRVSADWTDPAERAIGVLSDAVTKQASVGAVPPDSDVVLKRLGYSAVERKQLEEDRKRYEGRMAAKAIAESLNAPQQADEPGVSGGDAEGV